MRYLKEYAQFGNDSLYEPISYDDYTEFITSKSGWGKPLGFTEVEVNLIKSVLGSEDKFQLLTNGPASKNPQGELISVSGGYYGSWFNKKSSWKVTITKYRDEWFMGQSDKLIDKKSGKRESNLWKCDTIDGVIQLIKDVSSSSMNESVGNSDDYYFEIPKIEMEKIPSKDFMDIDSRVFEMVQSGLSQYIKENCPRVSAKLTRDNWIGLESEGIVIGGFGYYQSGFEKGKWHPIIKWMRRIKISQLRDEWFLVSITSSGYSTYFKCDQIDGLMKLLEDYYICESKMVKESVEEDKEILSDYFVDFEDSGGEVVVERGGRHAKTYLRVTSKKNNLTENDIWVVTIFTNEKHIKGKINWKRLEFDWNILDVDQQNHRISALPKKRTFTILLTKKKDMIKESIEESLAQKISVPERIKFQDSHSLMVPDKSDFKIYKEFMLENFSLEEVGHFKYVQSPENSTEFDWICEFEELNGNVGYITILKFDDEWYLVEHDIKGWNDDCAYWLVDTKEGFKDIKLWD
jgi:hypothetical protein